MASNEPEVDIDLRFSQPDAEATDWETARQSVTDAQTYWLTTVRADGRPHVTPLIGVWTGDAFHFCTGPTEQKALNLQSNSNVAVTTGNSPWDEGMDIIAEGAAVRVTDNSDLTKLAGAWETKYGSEWHFDVADGCFTHEANGEAISAYVFRVSPSKVFAFSKGEFSQTKFTFSTGSN